MYWCSHTPSHTHTYTHSVLVFSHTLTHSHSPSLCIGVLTHPHTLTLTLTLTHILTFLHIDHCPLDKHLPLLADTEHIKVTVRHVSVQIQVTHCVIVTAGGRDDSTLHVQILCHIHCHIYTVMLPLYSLIFFTLVTSEKFAPCTLLSLISATLNWKQLFLLLYLYNIPM